MPTEFPARPTATLPEATAVPVLYRGIDVFDHPIAEIEFLLDAMEPGIGIGTERDLRLTGLSGHALTATLVDPSRRG